VNWWEIGGFVFGATGVWLTVRQNIWCWPVGAVGVALYSVVFYDAKLYADMALQGVYFVLAIYGWYEWLYGGANHSELHVSRTPRKQLTLFLVVGTVASFSIGHFLYSATDAAIPYLDASLTSFSLVAQLMLTRKLIENWVIWIVLDVVYVGMFISRGLFLTSALYAVFLVLAISGYYEWRKSMVAERAAVEA
jgi:nicotinamide mononucleotide transporter